MLKHRVWVYGWALVVLLAMAAPASAAGRYSIAGGCFDIKGSAATGKLRAGGPFRMQATRLGEYLMLARDGRFLAADDDGTITLDRKPSTSAEWRVENGTGGALRVRSLAAEQHLIVAPDGSPSLGAAVDLTFQRASRCQGFQEIGTDATGTPSGNPVVFGEARGLIETHLHAMAFEFLGGGLHCGRPWHPYGPEYALADCPDHEPGGHGPGSWAENTLAYGNPEQGHSTDGWPTFAGWPSYRTYVHDQTYWKGMERAWRGGLRLWTNLAVENSILCLVYPIKRYTDCDTEMNSVLRQIKDIQDLQDYIDAQNGGPGKGWFRIVRDPFEARRVINAGKLAVVQGIETSKLFNCGETNHVPDCSRDDVERWLQEVHKLGVRQMELVNKFDNAFSGITGDDGAFGILVNNANKVETGHYWAMQTCQNPTAQHDHDKEQTAQSEVLGRDALVGGILKLFLPPDALPVYPPSPHCNADGLTDLGAYTLRRMTELGMIFDPDHMSVLARDQALSIMEAARYGGVLSSHSWSTPDAYRRILALGGLVTPASKRSEDFVKDWQDLKPLRNPRFFYGTGFSTDMNGFAAQGGPREDAEQKPLVYPIKTWDEAVTLDRAKWGERTWDLNKDGTAHFGMYPDRIADVIMLGGPDIRRDLERGAEAYLQIWERAVGTPWPDCRSGRRRFTRTGVSKVELGMGWEQVLLRFGQPQRRPGRGWAYCVKGTGKRAGELDVVFTPEGRVALITSTGHTWFARGVNPGAKAPRADVRRLTSGVLARSAGNGRSYLYGIRKGRVSWVALASRTAAKSPASIKSYLKLAGL